MSPQILSTEQPNHGNQISLPNKNYETEREQLDWLRGTYDVITDYIIPANRKMQKASLFDMIIGLYRNRTYYNINLLYKTERLYEEFRKNMDEGMEPEMFLAIFLQRVSGRNGSFSKSAVEAYKLLYLNCDIDKHKAMRVANIIKSCLTLKEPLTSDGRVFRNLHFARLGLPWKEFYKNQQNISHVSERLPTGKMEHFLAQLAIFRKLKNNAELFNFKFFKDKFEKRAIRNIDQYIEILIRICSDLQEDVLKTNFTFPDVDVNYLSLCIVNAENLK